MLAASKLKKMGNNAGWVPGVGREGFRRGRRVAGWHRHSSTASRAPCPSPSPHQRALRHVLCKQAVVVSPQLGRHLHRRRRACRGASRAAVWRGHQQRLCAGHAPVLAELLELGQAGQLNAVKLRQQLAVGTPRAEDAAQLLVPEQGGSLQEGSEPEMRREEHAAAGRGRRGAGPHPWQCSMCAEACSGQTCDAGACFPIRLSSPLLQRAHLMQKSASGGRATPLRRSTMCRYSPPPQDMSTEPRPQPWRYTPVGELYSRLRRSGLAEKYWE